MIRRLDAWIGLRLFHPPIIWLCQRAGMTQYAVAAYAWMAAALTLVVRIRSGDVVFAIVATLIAVLSTVSAALWPDMRRHRSLWFRVFIWALVLLDLVDRTVGNVRPGDPFVWRLAWDAFGLIGEYAKTIVTIPPRRRRERATKAQEAFS
jgi:hypothetical protein